MAEVDVSIAPGTSLTYLYNVVVSVTLTQCNVVIVFAADVFAAAVGVGVVVVGFVVVSLLCINE